MGDMKEKKPIKKILIEMQMKEKQNQIKSAANFFKLKTMMNKQNNNGTSLGHKEHVSVKSDSNIQDIKSKRKSSQSKKEIIVQNEMSDTNQKTNITIVPEVKSPVGKGKPKKESVGQTKAQNNGADINVTWTSPIVITDTE